MRIGDLAELLSRNQVFLTLPAHEFARLESEFRLRVFRLGDTILNPGDDTTGLFVIYSGRARVVEETAGGDPVTLGVLNPGEILTSGGSSTVRAASDLVLLHLDEAIFQSLRSTYPEFREEIERRARESVELSFLRRLSILSHLKLPDFRRLAAQLERIELAAGQELFREFEQGEIAYIVREGHLRVMKDFDGRQRQIAVANPGDLVGEMSLLCGIPRVATAVAATPVVVLALSKPVFDSVVSDEQRLSAMLREADDNILRIVAVHRDVMATPPQRTVFEVRWVKAASRWLARAFPVVRAENPALSGLAALAMAEAFHRKSGVPQADIDRKLSDGRPDTLERLSRAAEDLGYVTRLARLSPEQLTQLPLPAIIEAGDGQFSVLFAADRRQVTLASAEGGLQTQPRATFDAAWDRRVLALQYLPSAVFTGLRVSAIFRQFLPFARPHIKVLLWIAGISLFAQLLSLAPPLLNQVIIDKVLVTFEARLLRLLLLGMVLVTAFQLVAASLREYLTAHVMRRISSAVQLRFFHHILSLPMSVLGKWRVGDFTVRLHENETLLRLVSESGFRVILSSATIAVNIVLLFAMSSRMAPAALGFVAAYGLMIFFSSPRLRAANNKVFEARSSAESHFIESITGIQTIKSLALEPHSFRTGLGLIENLKSSEIHVANLQFTVSQIGELLGQASTVLVLGWGASLALDGKITTGELVAFNALLGATIAPLASLVGVWDQVQEIRISFERTGDILREERESNARNAAIFPLRGEVSFENVGFCYAQDSEPVLRDINLTVSPGQKIALVGRSGSGKTTLANLLLSLYQPTSGRILVDQVDIAAVHKGALRRQIGFVEQQPYLFSGTIRENIAKADPAAGLESVVSAATLAGAHEFIQDLPMGYDTQIGERGAKLSGGQKQRIVIARALLNNPRMLVFDEATSALDTESEQHIQRNLESIMAGKTSWIIAHRLSTVRNADRIVVLDRGRIVEQGSYAELMAQRGLYYYMETATA